MSDHEHQSENNEPHLPNEALNWAELERTEVDLAQEIPPQNSPPQNSPPPKKSKKKLVIILAIIGGILLLIGLTFFLYNFYTSNQNVENKIETTTDKAELTKLYDELISSYISSGKSEAEILALLEKAAKETGDQKYINEKETYLVKNPSFNLAPGAYQGTQNLEIIKGTAADEVYYTIDGSIPTKSSTKYTAAITLPIGETTVKAIEVNAKGIASPVIEGKYTLTNPPATTTTTSSVLTEEEFVNKLYGIWYKADTGSALKISQTTFREYIPTPLTTGGGDYVVVTTTESGGTIRVIDFVVDGDHQGPKLIEFDFGTLGDNKFSFRYEGKPWREFTYAEYLGGGQYRLPFEFAGSDIMTMD